MKPAQFDGVIHAADWMPTLCGLAGYVPKKDLKWDGRNLWPALSGQSAAPARQLFWASSSKLLDTAVRDGDWKLIVSQKPAKLELYNLAEDPNEQHDLAGKYPERVASLQSLLAKLARNDNDAKVPAPPKLVHDEDNDVNISGRRVQVAAAR